MRFELSQTTPPYLNRRFQLRMLSFVAMIGVIMFTLSAMNVRSRDGDARQVGPSPDTLTFEVRREELSLGEGEFVIPEADENGPRAQSPRTQTAHDDRELFTTRDKERGHVTSERDPLFPRRNNSTGRLRPVDVAEGVKSIDSHSFDEDETTVGARKTRQRPSGSVAPVMNDDWENPQRTVRQGERERSVTGVKFERDSFGSDELEPPIDLRRHRDSSDLSSYGTPEPRDDVAPVQIDTRYLDVVKDNTVGIRRDESEVFYWLLDHARRVPSKVLERAGLREVQYVNVMLDSDRYRGVPITIEGDLWRLYELDAGNNTYGVSKIYEGWVFTGDSSNHPYRIVCTSLGNGIEPGENLRKPVRITGYFFKREGYRSNGGVHVAPTLLARRIGINPMPNGIPLTAGILPYMIGTIMAVGLALLVTIVGFAIADGRSSREGMQRMRHSPQVSFAGLVVPETKSIEQSLQELAERDRDSAINGAYGPLFPREAAREHAVHDYAMSHQMLTEASDRLHRQQAGTLQSWSARQKAVQAEIDALRGPQSQQGGSDSNRDSLHSDLDPVKSLLVGPKTAKQHPSKLQPSIPAKPVANPAPASASSVITEVSPATTTPAKPSNIAYSASKLSEWEDEIARMTLPETEPRVAVISEFAAPIPAPTATSKVENPPADEMTRHPAARDLEKPGAEEGDSELGGESRVAFDRADRDSTSFSLAAAASAEPDPVGASNELEAEDFADEPDSSSRWARFRKRRNR